MDRKLFTCNDLPFRPKLAVKMAAKSMSASQLDAAARRLEQLEQEAEDLRNRLKEQIAEYGFCPPRADKSRRLVGEEYEFTLSTSTTTEVKDAEVTRIAQVCDPKVFNQLFRMEYRYKLVNGAMMLLSRTLPEGAPSNLRQLFSKAVILKESAPRLRIEPLKKEEVLEV